MHGSTEYGAAAERGPVSLLRRAAALGAATLVVPAPAYAHTGVCTAPEKLSTVVIGLIAGVAVMRPWRRTMRVTARSVLVRLVTTTLALRRRRRCAAEERIGPARAIHLCPCGSSIISLKPGQTRAGRPLWAVLLASRYAEGEIG